MRFHFGAIPESPDFDPGTPWRALREPTPWSAQILAAPIGVGMAVPIFVLWTMATPIEPPVDVDLWTLLLGFVLLVIVHETLHLAAHPMAGRSRRSVVGFWPSRALFYAHYDGEITRNRFVAILLMPLLFISIVPLVIAATLQVGSYWMALVSALNALLGCIDVLGVIMVLVQVPATATVRNQGWRTYWRQ